MPLNLNMSRQALGFIRKLPPKQYRQVLNAVMSLLANPEPHDSKLLKGNTKGHRSVSVGEYRIIYRVENDVVIVLVIGKRNDDRVYKIHERMH